MFPNRAYQYYGILRLLQYFRWTWIGVIHSDVNIDKTFVHNVLPMFSQNGICFDFILALHKMGFLSDFANYVEEETKLCHKVMNSTATVVVLHGEFQTTMWLRGFLHFAEFLGLQMKTKNKVWIMTAQMDFTSVAIQRHLDVDFIHGVLSFAVHFKDIPGFQKFLLFTNPASEKENGFIRDFWAHAFNCFFPDTRIEGVCTALEQKFGEICTGEEKLERLPGSIFEMSMTPHSYSIYSAVYAVAHAVHAMQSSKSKYKSIYNGQEKTLLNWPLWRVSYFT